MLSRRDVESHALRIVDHAAIGAEIHPAFVRVAGSDQARSADKATAIELVHERHREFEQVDLVTGIDVLKNRTLRDDFVLDRLMGDELLAEGSHQIQVG